MPPDVIYYKAADLDVICFAEELNYEGVLSTTCLVEDPPLVDLSQLFAPDYVIYPVIGLCLESR